MSAFWKTDEIEVFSEQRVLTTNFF